MSSKECPSKPVGRIILLLSVLGVLLLYSFGASDRSDDQCSSNAITLSYDAYTILLMLGSTAIVVTCIPMIIDLIFDLVNYDLFPGWEYRVVCILVAVLPYFSITHHLLTSSPTDNMNAIVYNNSIFSYKCIYIIVTSIFLSLQIRLFPTKHKSIVLLICQVCIIASQLPHNLLPSTTKQFSTSNDTLQHTYNTICILLTYIPMLVSVYYIPTIIVTACVRWSKLADIEFTYTLYLLFTLLYLISIHITSYIYDNSSHTAAKFIFLVQIYTIIYYTILNTIPIRILHTTNTNNIEKLKSKTNFIRYISHEIRSSLNIVFAGIEMTLKECIQLTSNTNTSSNNNNTLNSVTAATTKPNFIAPTTPITTTTSSTDNSDNNSDNTDTPTPTTAIGAPQQHHTASIIDHIQEVYESTHTAILLLNDFLHYENIEADTFQLELSLRQVPRLLGM